MKNEFVKYEQALALKELGFDEPCLAYFDAEKLFKFPGTTMCNRNFLDLLTVTAPLYQQAFRWFREKHLTYGIIMPTNVSEIQGIDCILEIHPPPDKHGIVYILEDAKLYTSYEEAESACLDKLIEICKNK